MESPVICKPFDRLKAAVAFAVLAATTAASAAPASPVAHTFVLTYRGFGPVAATSGFRNGDGYDLRFEGCYAKHSQGAICGFTLRATRPLRITNVQNVSHATGRDGSPIRTCCMFVQGDQQGFPITATSSAPAGVAILARPLRVGQTLGLMLRVPDYAKGAPVAGVTCSRGDGDPGGAFATRVAELP